MAKSEPFHLACSQSIVGNYRPIRSFVYAPNNPYGSFQGRLGINQVQNLELFHLTAHAIIPGDNSKLDYVQVLFTPKIIHLAKTFPRLQSRSY